MKMAAKCSSEISVDSQLTTLRYITENRTFQNDIGFIRMDRWLE
jgi:hypothetical protein